MLRQTTIFDAIAEATIRPHNNRDSQRQCEDNANHFAGQAKWVFDELMKGRELTNRIVLQENNIEDLRARMHTLKTAGYQFSDGKIKGGHGGKFRFMTPEQIEFNRLHRPEVKPKIKKS